MTRLAIAEVVSAKTCPHCEGRGEAIIGGRVMVCKHCLGARRKAWTARTRYDAIGIDKRNWERTWAPRYERWLMPIVAGLERRGLAALRNGLDDL
jgi:hypothetical protein